MLAVALAGALLLELPPDITDVAFNLNLKVPFVFAGTVALIVIAVPAVAVVLGVSNIQL